VGQDEGRRRAIPQAGPARPARTQADGDITAETRVSVLAETRYAGLKDLSPVTMQADRDRLDRQILPGLGQLHVRELSIGVLDDTSG
jgi:hypothetical protein